MTSETYINCNLCGSNSTILLGIENSCNICQCRNCGLVYVNPRPIIEPIDYFDIRTDPEVLKNISYLSYQKALAKIETYHNKGRLLDLGCGYGFFMDLARDRGWDVYGVDSSKIATKYAAEELDLNVFCGEIDEINFPETFFDVVVMWCVLEHLPDPMQNLRKVYRILSKDGLLVTRTPNMESFHKAPIFLKVCRILGKELSLMGGAPLHLFVFSPRTIRKIAKSCGFSDIQIFPADINLIRLESYIGSQIVAKSLKWAIEWANKLLFNKSYALVPSIMMYAKK